MKIVFDGLIGLLDTDKERISELEDINRNFQNWNAKEKKKNIDEMWNNCKGVAYIKWKYQKKEKKGKKKYLK